MVFPIENRKIALLHASMVITYYIKLFRTEADRHNVILMSLLLLVAETTNYRLAKKNLDTTLVGLIREGK